ncbi:THAP domain-containing protein 1-like [Chelonus insularis]|uniref:THAP domain-containing protein 1-like n=1 Tax=Chelonus insularis TaxID=460826 RepID=UPI00158A2C85|nr:THAP domain-containing protein 1-like [Chelonus insularis]
MIVTLQNSHSCIKMPSRSICAFSNCRNSSSKTPHLSFHRFPKSESIATEWIIRSGNNDLFDLNPEQLYQKRLCSEHFDPNCFIVNQPGHRRRLYHNALPRIMLYDDNNSKNDNYIEVNNISTSSMSLLPYRTSSILEKSNLNAYFSTPLTSISTPSNRMSSTSPLKVTTPISKTYNNINLLNKKLTILEEKLKNAQKIIKNLRQAYIKSKPRAITVKTFLKDAEKFLNKKQLLLLKIQLNRNKKKKFNYISSN